MTINNAQLSKFNAHLPLAIILSLSGIMSLSACQKEPESTEAQDDVIVQSTPVATSIISDEQTAEVEVIEKASVDIEPEVGIKDDSSAIGAGTNVETVDPQQALKGTQITDVQYRSDSGSMMSVVFETSATGVLNAIVTLPNKPKMTLSAPEGQGNNPTYRSKDGSIELVSHGGGGSIDLMQDNKVTKYQAISADAEVVTPS